MKMGIGMVQQHFMLFEPMTVTENIVYNNEQRKYGFMDRKKNIEKVRELSEKYGLDVDPEAVIRNCSVGTQQRVEILKTLYQNADIIIFDEPSAVLTPGEVDDLLKTMKNLAKAGKSLIIITHKLNEVMEVADRVVVMRAGVVVGRVNKTDTSTEELSYMMIGRQLMNLDIVPVEKGRTLLSVHNLSMANESGKKVLENVNLHVEAGEIVGIAGVSGNGQSELIRCITGLQREYEGTITVDGTDVSNKTVDVVRKAGLSYIPEDRYMWGSAVEASLSDNLLMGEEDSEAYSRNGILKQNEIDRHADEMIREYRVKVDTYSQKMRELSGGNAQKIIAAREIERNVPLTIACEPTRGIDIGAMEFVHEKLVGKKENGGAVLLVSSELSEILKLSDRIYVMYDGRLNHEFKNGEINDRQLGIVMLGGEINEEN